MVTCFENGLFDVFGFLCVIFMLGYMLGYCVLYFFDCDVVIVGDAVVIFDLYMGWIGLWIVVCAVTVDSECNLCMLDALVVMGV